MFASVTIADGGFVVVVDHPNTILIFTQGKDQDNDAIVLNPFVISILAVLFDYCRLTPTV